MQSFVWRHMTEIQFAAHTSLHKEPDRPSSLPIIGNGPPGTFVVFAHGLRVSLPTDQIVWSDDTGGSARLRFGGMQFEGVHDRQLRFRRVREMQPEAQLSPDRSHVMTLEPEWVATIAVEGRIVWPAVVYKIVPARLWRDAEASGQFDGSPVDLQDGFIHFSTAAQVRETAARHFAGVADLLLLAVAMDGDAWRWEPSRGGDLFPHLYAPLPRAAVQWMMPLPIAENGRHVFPALE